MAPYQRRKSHVDNNRHHTARVRDNSLVTAVTLRSILHRFIYRASIVVCGVDRRRHSNIRVVGAEPLMRCSKETADALFQRENRGAHYPCSRVTLVLALPLFSHYLITYIIIIITYFNIKLLISNIRGIRY